MLPKWHAPGARRKVPPWVAMAPPRLDAEPVVPSGLMAVALAVFDANVQPPFEKLITSVPVLKIAPPPDEAEAPPGNG